MLIGARMFTAGIGENDVVGALTADGQENEDRNGVYAPAVGYGQGGTGEALSVIRDLHVRGSF